MHKLTPIPNLLEDKEDKTLFIVGGGPSLTNFDWSLLEGKNVLVLNRGVEKVPNALALLWNDVKFHKDNEENIKNFQGIKITTTRYMLPGSSHPCECDIIWVKGRNYLSDACGIIEDSPYTINQGSNTGYSALNVAYHLGAKTIYLLGYDMKLDKDKTDYEILEEYIKDYFKYDCEIVESGEELAASQGAIFKVTEGDNGWHESLMKNLKNK